MALNLTMNQTLSGINQSLIGNQSLTSPMTGDMTSIIAHIKPLVLIILGIAIYGIIIFKFYRFLARRDILELKWHHRYDWQEGFGQRLVKTFFYILEHIVLVPITVFFWFAIMAIILLFLSSNSPELIMLISMAIVGAVRITAYYKEDLSKDLAKLVPFALLGVFIVDIEFISVAAMLAKAQALLMMTGTLAFYLLFVVAVELIMRIVFAIYAAVRNKDIVEKED